MTSCRLPIRVHVFCTCKDQLFSALLPCNLGRGAAEDAAYVATEAALGAAAQQLKANRA